MEGTKAIERAFCLDINYDLMIEYGLLPDGRLVVDAASDDNELRASEAPCRMPGCTTIGRVVCNGIRVDAYGSTGICATPD